MYVLRRDNRANDILKKLFFYSREPSVQKVTFSYLLWIVLSRLVEKSVATVIQFSITNR